MTTGPRPHYDAEDARHMLTEMIRIRRFEERAAEQYTQTKIRGFLHLYIGEEAIAVGVMRNLNDDDAVVATYREHGQALARGLTMRSIMAEMYGKQEGCSRGRGGSMHLFDGARRFYGGNAIVAGGMPLAVGLALADRLCGRSRVTACFFGEGAMAEGEFHESINLAALWGLPVLFCCENNGYAMGTALDISESQIDLAAKARSYCVDSETVDGMDVAAVDSTVRRVVHSMRTEPRPVFLELKTYRFRAHSMFDPQLYRDKEEVEVWKERCPIEAWKRTMREHGQLDAAAEASIEADVAREVEDSVEFAEAGTWEPVEDLMRFVLAETQVPA